jgi:hypothetical protein
VSVCVCKRVCAWLGAHVQAGEYGSGRVRVCIYVGW